MIAVLKKGIVGHEHKNWRLAVRILHTSFLQAHHNVETHTLLRPLLILLRLHPLMKTSLIQPILLAALALPGVPAMATEEPPFELLSKHDHVELRRYPAFIVAETFVEGDMDGASGKGFRAIADYIFGNNVAAGSAQNKASEKITMTAPVTVEPVAAPSQKISMTAPVTMEPLPEAGRITHEPQAMQGAKRWRVHFVMPSHYTLATLPKPNNPAVQLREVPSKTWAVLGYTGFNTETTIQQRTEELEAWLAAQKIKSIGSPHLARYNPPWTLPMFRRNEIMLEVSQP
jgi:hypothetical protein